MPYVAQPFVQRRQSQIMADHGEAMKLQRGGQADLPVKGKRLMRSRSGGKGEFSNSAADTNLYVRIANTEILAAGWPGPPKIGDIVALADNSQAWSILHVDTRVDSGTVLAHFLFIDG